MENRTVKPGYPGVDVGKFLCALLILFYHYFSEHGPLPGVLDEILSLYAIAVALFMVISGFLLFNKLQCAKDRNQRWLIAKKQVVRIYKTYLLWSIPYLLFTVCQWDWSKVTAEFLFWKLQGWVFTSTFYTIWFMPVLAIGLLVAFWVTEKLPNILVIFLGVLCYGIGALSNTYRFFANRIPGFELLLQFETLWLGSTRGWLFFAFPLLLIGRSMVYFKKKTRPVPMAILSCCSVLVLLVEALLIRKIAGIHTGIDMAVMMVPTVFFILGFLISVPFPQGDYCIWMRKMSTLIFMSQRIFLTVLPTLFPAVFLEIFANRYIGAGCIGLMVLASSETIILLSKKNDLARMLY